MTTKKNKAPTISAAQQAASMLGKRSYKARLKRFGIERLQAIARKNGKLGGRPPKASPKAKGKG